MNHNRPHDYLLHAPQKIQDAYELQQVRDRVFFEEHPKTTSYRRPANWAEFWPISINPQSNPVVEVTQLAPGVRARHLVGAVEARIWDDPLWLGDNSFEEIRQAYEGAIQVD